MRRSRFARTLELIPRWNNRRLYYLGRPQPLQSLLAPLHHEVRETMDIDIDIGHHCVLHHIRPEHFHQSLRCVKLPWHVSRVSPPSSYAIIDSPQSANERVGARCGSDLHDLNVSVG